MAQAFVSARSALTPHAPARSCCRWCVPRCRACPSAQSGSWSATRPGCTRRPGPTTATCARWEPAPARRRPRSGGRPAAGRAPPPPPPCARPTPPRAPPRRRPRRRPRGRRPRLRGGAATAAAAAVAPPPARPAAGAPPPAGPPCAAGGGASAAEAAARGPRTRKAPHGQPARRRAHACSSRRTCPRPPARSAASRAAS